MDLDEPAAGAGAAPGASPAEPSIPPPPPARHDHKPLSWPYRLLLVFAALFVATVVAGFLIHMPYTTIEPGEALSLPPRVQVRGGHEYPNGRGDIRLLFIRESNHVNLWQYVRARLDDRIDLVKDSAVNPGKLTPAQLSAQNFQAMADAKTSATYVALRAAGYQVKAAPGLTISDLSPDRPAIKVLRWGDVLLSADGRALRGADDLSSQIKKHKPGEEVTLVVDRPDEKTATPKRITVRVPIASSNGRLVIGVLASPRFTFPLTVNVDTTNIGGPSAGLAMTLAIYDDLTPGDLSGGHRVAVTGTIDNEGNVGEIGGIEQKALSAHAAKVSIFLVPKCSPDDPPAALAGCRDDLARAERRAGSAIKVVPVATFDEALAALRAAGGAPAAPSSSSTTAPTAA